MATMNEMRQAVLDAYPNATMKWREHIAKTKNTRQIVAIYRKICMGYSDKQLSQLTKPEEFHQMDIFEWQLANQESGTHTEVVV